MEDVDVVVADVLHGVDESLTGETPSKAGNVSIGDVLDVANSSKGAHSRYLVEICKASSQDIWMSYRSGESYMELSREGRSRGEATDGDGVGVDVEIY